MENTTKKQNKKSFFHKTKRFIRKSLKRVKRLVNNLFEMVDESIIKSFCPETIKNKALKREYLKLLAIQSNNNLTNLDSLTVNIGNSTIASETISPIEAEILKRIQLITAKEKAKNLRKAYRKRIVAEKLKSRTTVNSDTNATDRIIYAVKSNPIPALAYSEVTPNNEKPVFQANHNKNQTITLQNYYQNTRE